MEFAGSATCGREKVELRSSRTRITDPGHTSHTRQISTQKFREERGETNQLREADAAEKTGGYSDAAEEPHAPPQIHERRGGAEHS
jgi:hypothetical protein